MVTGRALLRSTLRAQARRLALSSLLFAGHQGGEALVPLLVGVVVDRAIAVGDTTALLRWLAVLAAVFLVLSLSWRGGIRRAQAAALRAAQQARLDLTSRVTHPGGGATDRRLPGELVNVATEDATRVGRVCFGLPPTVSALVVLVVAGGALLTISVPLGLVVLGAMPPLLVVLRLLSRALSRRSRVEQDEAGRASGTAADLVDGLRVLKGAAAEEAARQRYQQASRASLTATVRATRTQAWHTGSLLATNGVLLAGVALVAGVLAARGAISVGELVAAVGLAQHLLSPLQVLGWFAGILARGRASAERLAAVSAAPPTVAAGARALPAPLRGEVRVRGLRHGTLAGLDLTARPGELLGVVADPADAAALVPCLSRDADPVEGRVELDGVSVAELDPAEARAGVLVTAHDATLFADSLIDNVAAAAPAGADLDGALCAAQADDVADALPQGRRSPVGESGRALSGGQRQRVVLARSLAADPPVLVLHEPTTAVDAVTEARIADGLRQRRRGRTTIVITTSPALLAACDRVVMVDGGVTAGSGAHDELLRDHGRYRQAVGS